MKDTRRKLEFFAPYDYDGMTSHFEQMALEGWLIVGVKGNLWKYKKIQPQKLKFAVTHFEFFTVNEAAPDNGQNEFVQMCAEAGWQLTAHNKTLMVFVTDSEDTVPLETDPAVRLRNVFKSVKPMFVLKNLIILSNIIHNKVMNGWEQIIAGEAININYTYLIISLFMFILINIDTLDYIKWHLKATEVMKEQGIFYRQKTNKPVYVLHRAIRFILIAIMFVFFALMFGAMCYIAFSGEVML